MAHNQIEQNMQMRYALYFVQFDYGMVNRKELLPLHKPDHHTLISIQL